jgi:acyl carrier protein
MNQISAAKVREVLLAYLQTPLAARGMDRQNLPDDFDLLTEGVIDSNGVVEMISTLEDQLGIQIEFEELDPEHLTVVGPLCRYFSAKSSGFQAISPVGQ